MSGVLHQRVLEGIDRVGWCPSLERQLGSNEPAESGLQLILVKAGDGPPQRVGKLASNRSTDLCHNPHRPETIEARQQRVAECRRDHEGGNARSTT